MADVSREPSAAPSSGGDTIDDQAEERKAQTDDYGRDASLDPESEAPVRTPSSSKPGRRGRGGASAGLSASRRGRGKNKGNHNFILDVGPEGTEDEGSVVSTSRKKQEGSQDPDAKTIGTAVGTRRQANGTVGSVYSGSKIRHIKKPDGTPLWRKEIQYEFLRLVIEDDTKVFTKASDGQKDFNFADIYIDCMARSSKTSKILKDRLQVDRQAAQNMAMICLLVNVGRMNTTLNFFPEMRAQLRTYHSIPSLQAYKSQRDYKSLQDAPRLKSILKGASEDEEQPRSIPAIKQRPVPRTNPVNLIFVISQFAPKVSEMHFSDKVDFFDLTMRSTISSKSRARAFLWLMWWYLESDFSREAALSNPFGPGEYREDQDPGDMDAVPELVPRLEFITEEEGDLENADPEEEKAFAKKMTEERKRISAELANDPPLTMHDPGNPTHQVLKRLKKNATYGDEDSMMSDADSRASPGLGRSPAPDTAHGQLMSSALGGQADSLEDDWEAVDPHPGRGRYKRVRGKNTPSRTKVRGSAADRQSLKPRISGTPDTTDRHRGTPQPPLQPTLGNHPVISQFGVHRGRHELDGLLGKSEGLSSAAGTKARARTGYQRELEEHRNRRVEWALRRRRRETRKLARIRRERERWLLKAARRISELPPTYDSEEDDEGGSLGVGGFLGRRWVATGTEGDDGKIPAGYEADDYGEEAETWLKVFHRVGRRLEVWSGDRDIAAYHARVQAGPGAATGTSPVRPRTSHGTPKGKARGIDVHMGDESGTRITSGNVGRATREELNNEITQDLLAERSDDEMMGDEDEDDEADEDGEGDEEGSDVDMG